MLVYAGIILAVVFFVWQLSCIEDSKSLAKRLIPICPIAAGLLFCAAVAIFGEGDGGGLSNLQFALILAIVPLGALIGDVLAWALTAIIKRFEE